MMKNKFIFFFLIIIGIVLIIIGITSEPPEPIPKEGTISTLDEKINPQLSLQMEKTFEENLKNYMEEKEK